MSRKWVRHAYPDCHVEARHYFEFMNELKNCGHRHKSCIDPAKLIVWAEDHAVWCGLEELLSARASTVPRREY